MHVRRTMSYDQRSPGFGTRGNGNFPGFPTGNTSSPQKTSGSQSPMLNNNFKPPPPPPQFKNQAQRMGKQCANNGEKRMMSISLGVQAVYRQSPSPQPSQPQLAHSSDECKHRENGKKDGAVEHAMNGTPNGKYPMRMSEAVPPQANRCGAKHPNQTVKVDKNPIDNQSKPRKYPQRPESHKHSDLMPYAIQSSSSLQSSKIPPSPPPYDDESPPPPPPPPDDEPLPDEYNILFNEDFIKMKCKVNSHNLFNIFKDIFFFFLRFQ